jgi:hypothetical protein
MVVVLLVMALLLRFDSHSTQNLLQHRHQWQHQHHHRQQQYDHRQQQAQ